MSEDSDLESYDSDAELQKAFAEKRLLPGLSVEVAPQKKKINNVKLLKQRLQNIRLNLNWVERLDLTYQPEKPVPGTEKNNKNTDVHDDFKREMKFYRQAQEAVLEALPKLKKLGIPSKRPEDYFAEMAKSDRQMKKVRGKLITTELQLEKSEQAKKLREQKKFGKKVQIQVHKNRQKEKKDMLEAVKKYRKGQKDQLDFEMDSKADKGKREMTKQNTKKVRGKSKLKSPARHNTTDQEARSVKDVNHLTRCNPGMCRVDRPHKLQRVNRRREMKNARYGFGGQKKRSKYNTAESSADFSDYYKIHKKDFGKKGHKEQQKTQKKKRFGKLRRMKIKKR